MTTPFVPNVWTRRYEQKTSIEEVRKCAAVKGPELPDLGSLPIEVACARMEAGLKVPFVPTQRSCEIIVSEIERALAKAQATYTDSGAVLRLAYGGVPDIEPMAPSLITGPSGTGKTQLLRAIRRVLSGRNEVQVDVAHNAFPLIDYADVVVGGQRSVAGMLRQLASPETAKGKGHISEAALPQECARWQHLAGICLFGVDETQFLTQSIGATTLVTRALLAFSSIGTPWHAITNYSLCWKLLSRPSEAMQRLLGRPVLLLPDPPGSSDWHAVLTEYELVCGEAFDFRFSDQQQELWNLCAGIKRELVKLLVQAYRISRRRNASKVLWTDVTSAYASMEFFASRRDTELVIAHAAQGGALRKDLRCPFEGGVISASLEGYKKDLRGAREKNVAKATIKASMTLKERQAFEKIQADLQASQPPQTAKVIPIKRRVLRSLEGLQEAGRRHTDSLHNPPAPTVGE